MMVGVSTGWHAHLDMLAARLNDEETEPFWERFTGWDRCDGPACVQRIRTGAYPAILTAPSAGAVRK